MNQQSTAGIRPAVKQSILLLVVAVAVVLFFVFVFTKSGPKATKIIGEGDRAPEFTLSTTDGRPVSLSALRGKIVMVHFWATWCPPCVDEIPTLDALRRRMTGKDFELVAISVDENGAAGVVPFLQRNRLALPVLLDPDHAVSKQYGTFKFPETYILDRNGIVKYKVIGARDWNDPSLQKGLQELIAAK